MDERTGIGHREGLRVVGKSTISDTFGNRHGCLVLSDGSREAVDRQAYFIARVGSMGYFVEELNPGPDCVWAIDGGSKVNGKPWLNYWVKGEMVVN
ncbi:hypothetical protein KJ652_00855 [Patescibacteria group bacterium]|nr:hypothetical protein [Nanoarchaeota archaeon]MBU1123120.1 hypothetical protein [Patescibacteria group bacterium]